MEPLIGLDHNYSRHWSESYKTDTSHAKPIQWLMPACKSDKSAKNLRSIPNIHKASSSSDGSDDEIDVESLDEVLSTTTTGGVCSYDMQRARMCMNETERYTFQNLTGGKHGSNLRSETDWEENLNQSSWTRMQMKIFNKVVKILEDEKLSRLAFTGVNNEPIARRLSLDRSAARLRRVMAEVSWDQKLSQWLHSLMMSRLPPSMLATYLDLIQTLRSKVPTLVERMIMLTSNASSADSLNLLLKRPWEPTMLKSMQTVKQRLSNPPLILLVPNSPYASSPTMAHRKRFWNTYLGQIGKLIQLTPPEAAPGITVISYLEQLAASVRSRINGLRHKHPGRPIVLAGWHTTSLLNCQISLVEKVSAIICLGFPMNTMNGSRGTVDDVLCDLFTPTLFVVGEESDSCDINDLEDFREQLLTNCENHLLAVPGADDALKVSDKVRKKACLTQAMIDKLIIDYISKFLYEVFKADETSVWHVSSPLLDEAQYAVSRHYASQAIPSGRRKREMSDEGLSSVKRRRLSSSTTAKISEVLSGQKTGRNRDGTKSPVQGVTYNLQTGSISGLTTVPTVLGRTKSVSKDNPQTLKQGMQSTSNKNQSRSITIDLTKDTSAQLTRFSTYYGAAPAKSLLATESQTEAAVATILGNGSNNDAEREKIPSSPVQSKTEPSTPTAQDLSTSSDSTSAFTRLSTSTLPPTSNITATITPEKQSLQQGTKISPNSLQMTIGSDVGQLSRQAQSYTNVKFKSTLIAPKGANEQSHIIAKPHWTPPTPGTGEIMTMAPQGKFSQFLSRHTSVSAPQSTFTTSHISSRSRKDERETMQATAILEKLTSLENESEPSTPTSPVIEDSFTATRRHSYDSTLVQPSARGRGRVRTRGVWMSDAKMRDTSQKRRKTINEERPIPGIVQSRRSSSTPQTKDSVVRYVMTSDMSSVLSNAAAKAAAASGKTFPNKHSGITILPEKNLFPKQHKVKYTSQQPSILPVYAITPVTSHTPITTVEKSTKYQNVSSPVVINKSSVSHVPAGNRGATAANIQGSSKSPKVFLSKTVPVKLPFTGPGPNYTFVTIPTVTGALATATHTFKSSANTKTATVTERARATDPGNMVKYSVLSQGMTSTKVVHQSKAKPATAEAGRVTVNLREKALSKPADKKLLITYKATGKTTSTLPMFSSPSVVLQKLWTDTVAELGATDPKNGKK